MPVASTTGRALGAVSAALGLPAAIAPEKVASAIGLRGGGTPAAVLRAVGVRELAAAGGLLAKPAPWQLWGRVAGDAIDLGLLGTALAGRGAARRGRLAAVTAAITAITATDVLAALAASGDGEMVEVHSVTTLATTPAEAYAAWRRFDDFPRFMAHVESVTVEGLRSHWVVQGPAGATIEYDATITDDRPGQAIAWRSDDDATVGNEGTVRFSEAPGGRGTEVHVTLRHQLPGGRVGRVVSRLSGQDPRQQLDDDLRRFKQVVETGEVVRSDGAPWGKRARHEFPQRPAQPLSDHDAEELSA